MKKRTDAKIKKIGLFDHVKHIKQIQDPNYFKNLSDEDRKSFNPFMILRALSMDENLVDMMASLYSIYDKIPLPQLYTLLISLVPKSDKYCPWVKSKSFKSPDKLIEIVAKWFEIPKYQANTYIPILLKTEDGQAELVSICKSYVLSDSDIESALVEEKE